MNVFSSSFKAAFGWKMGELAAGLIGLIPGALIVAGIIGLAYLIAVAPQTP